MSEGIESEGLRREFFDRFPGAVSLPSEVRVVRSPGRVNLIGEHTDYNDGLVLPAAIDREILIAFAPSDDRRVELELFATSDRRGFDLAALGPPQDAWIDYVAGMAWAMAEAGAPTAGFRGLLESDLPPGAGLSSSAALELAAAWALSDGSPPTLGAMELARTAQRAENEYVGVRCGLMDQFAVAHGVADSALLFDCRSLDWRAVRLPAGTALVVCHSGVRRSLEGSAYNERRADCERAVATLSAIEGPTARSLRDVDRAMLDRHRDRLDATAYRRALHVVEENERVIETVQAFEAGDLAAIGRLFAASHASLRDLFEVSSEALDSLVAIAGEVEGVVGARLTGAGFAGCTVNLVRHDAVSSFRAAIEREHPARTGLTPTVLEVQAADGAGLVGPPA
jgi:galactokinase